jgi:predicted transcriptional regulator of viral defense system
MKHEELLRRVPDHGVFRTGQILAGEKRPADVRRQIDRWTRSGKVFQLRRGVYMVGSPYAKSPPHPFLVANVLARGSYVSLQSALAHYGMIPEHVPVITSVTTGRPEELSTSSGRFQFRHVARHLFNGFTEIEVAPGQRVLLATPCKALIDLLYLTPRSDGADYLRELRITWPSGFDVAELSRVAADIGSKKVVRAVARLVDVREEF